MLANERREEGMRFYEWPVLGDLSGIVRNDGIHIRLVTSFSPPVEDVSELHALAGRPSR